MTVAASSWPFLSRAEGLGCAGEAASASPVFPLPLLSLSLAAAAGQPARPSMTVAASSWPLLSRAEGLGCAGEAASASPVFQGQLWVLAGVLGRLGGEATAVEELRLPPLPFGSLPPLPDPAAGSAARRGWWCESQIGRNLSPSALTMKENLQFGRRTCFINPDDIGEGAIKLWTIEGKRVVSSDWIDGCSNLSGSDCTTPSSSNCQRAVISTSKRKRLRVEGNSASQQEFFSEENENGKFHHWLHCPFDTSETFTIQEFISNNEDHVTQLVPTPGSDNNHLSILAAPEVKLYSRKSYLAMAAMHADGMTMRGNFGAVNFVVDRSRSIKIGNLTAGKLKEIKSKDDVDMDKNSFANMIKNEVLLGKSIPNDIYEWILALLSGEPRELLSCHIGLLEDFLGGHILMTLYDRLLDLEKDDSEAYNSVILALPQYDGWKRRPKFLRNSFLEQTFNYEDKTGKKTIYKDNVRGLLHLLRNCKRHAAISVELFSCIVGQYFRRIASDFQKAMHKVGCLQKLNLHYILS